MSGTEGAFIKVAIGAGWESAYTITKAWETPCVAVCLSNAKGEGVPSDVVSNETAPKGLTDLLTPAFVHPFDEWTGDMVYPPETAGHEPSFRMSFALKSMANSACADRAATARRGADIFSIIFIIWLILTTDIIS